jgi:hypothetical protein
MSEIYGILGISDNERVFVNAIGQDVVYDATKQILGDHNADLERAKSIFVERMTTDHKLRYKLAGGGRMQQRDRYGRPGAVKATGEWDVAFPIKDFADQIGNDDISLAYMTMQDYDLNLDTIMRRNLNTVRFEILQRLFTNTQTSLVDPIYGTLAIEPLANGDTVVYPPVIGSESEATEDHYLEAGYLASAISDTNNPYATVAADLTHHFGKVTGGSPLVAFMNSAQTPLTRALGEFVKVPDTWERPGNDTATPTGLPSTLPGKVIGRLSSSGVWVCEWDWIPANYIVGLHLDAPKPLIERVDEEGTGLERGLALVAEDEKWPLQASVWRHRFGYGVGNRLNGVVMEVANGGTYTIPTAYA